MMETWLETTSSASSPQSLRQCNNTVVQAALSLQILFTAAFFTTNAEAVFLGVFLDLE